MRNTTTAAESLQDFEQLEPDAQVQLVKELFRKIHPAAAEQLQGADEDDGDEDDDAGDEDQGAEYDDGGEGVNYREQPSQRQEQLWEPGPSDRRRGWNQPGWASLHG